jgi:hypothetical protein
MRDKIERIALLATVVVSALVAVLHLLGLLETIPWLTDRVPTITLLVLAILAGYLISQRVGEHEELEGIKDLISESAKITVASLSGVEAATKLSTEEGREYSAKSFETAKRSIDAALLAPSLPPSSSDKIRDDARAKLLKANKVNYRSITVFDKSRWEGTKPYLTDPGIQKFYVRYYDLPIGKPPLMSFLIIDNQEIFLRYPYEPGEPEIFVSIKHPEIVQLFAAYYRSMWKEAIPLSRDDRQKIEEIDRRFSGRSGLIEQPG